MCSKSLAIIRPVIFSRQVFSFQFSVEALAKLGKAGSSFQFSVFSFQNETSAPPVLSQKPMGNLRLRKGRFWGGQGGFCNWLSFQKRIAAPSGVRAKAPDAPKGTRN
jgi:hypothetical protein